MRSLHRAAARVRALAATAPPLAQDAEAARPREPARRPTRGLMFWTLLIFVLLLVVLAQVRLQAAHRGGRGARAQRSRTRSRARSATATRPPRCSPSSARQLEARAARRSSSSPTAAPRARSCAPRCSSRRAAAAGRAARARAPRDRRGAQARDRRAAPRGGRPRASPARRRSSSATSTTPANRQLVESFLATVAGHGARPRLMRDPTIARNYAEALLALARKAATSRAWGHMIADVATRWSSDLTPAPLPRVAARLRRAEERDPRPGVRGPRCRASSCASSRRS